MDALRGAAVDSPSLKREPAPPAKVLWKAAGLGGGAARLRVVRESHAFAFIHAKISLHSRRGDGREGLGPSFGPERASSPSSSCRSKTVVNIAALTHLIIAPPARPCPPPTDGDSSAVVRRATSSSQQHSMGEDERFQSAIHP